MKYIKTVDTGVTAWMRVWVCALIAALLAGCAGLAPRMEPLSVTIADFSMGSASLFEQRIILDLRIQNPNSEDITIDGMAFDLEVNDQPFAKGVGNQVRTVPRYGSAVMQVEAVSSLGGLVAQISALARTGKPEFKYRIKGTLSVGGGSVIPFDKRGGFDWSLSGRGI